MFEMIIVVVVIVLVVEGRVDIVTNDCAKPPHFLLVLGELHSQST